MSKERVEAMDNAVEAKGNTDLPKSILMKTKTGEIIVMEAINDRAYVKKYYISSNYPNGEPRRIKNVKLPVSQDERKFESVVDLFKYLHASGRYKFA